MTRTFIALEMNEDMQRRLAGEVRRVAQALPGVRCVDPAGIHLTLAFLGELDDEQLAQAMAASEIAARRVAPFSCRLTRLGIFGSPRQPRVIWMGIDEPSGALALLHRTLTYELTRRGFETDQRPFSPHLTLARIKSPLSADEQQSLQALLASGQPGSAPTRDGYPARTLNVMKSELSRAGARYTCLRAFPLDGA
jgi:2'-5' RNA ligase